MKKTILKTVYVLETFERCLRCGKILKSNKSRILGYGPKCYKEHLKESQTTKKEKRLF